jgi:hypothetical protein
MPSCAGPRIVRQLNSGGVRGQRTWYRCSLAVQIHAYSAQDCNQLSIFEPLGPAQAHDVDPSQAVS